MSNLKSGFDFQEDEVDFYTLPKNYSSEYEEVHNTPKLYSLFSGFKESKRYNIERGTEIAIQGPVPEEISKLTTNVKFDLYYDPTSYFALDNEDEKLHFQVLPSPRIEMPILSTKEIKDKIVVMIDG